MKSRHVSHIRQLDSSIDRHFFWAIMSVQYWLWCVTPQQACVILALLWNRSVRCYVWVIWRKKAGVNQTNRAEPFFLFFQESKKKIQKQKQNINRFCACAFPENISGLVWGWGFFPFFFFSFFLSFPSSFPGFCGWGSLFPLSLRRHLRCL